MPVANGTAGAPEADPFCWAMAMRQFWRHLEMSLSSHSRFVTFRPHRFESCSSVARWPGAVQSCLT